MDGPCSFGQAVPFVEPARRLDPVVYALRKARIDAGISQRVMALKVGVGMDTYKKWEQGVISPSYFNIVAWAQALGKKLTLGDAA